MEKIEKVTRLRNDEPHHYALTCYPLTGGGGRGVVIRIDDITQRINMEEMMVQSEKMLSVGSLAAGMAHEINNPSAPSCTTPRTYVAGSPPSSSAIARRPRKPGAHEAVNRACSAAVPQLLDGIQQAGSRAAKIVSHMLSFSRMSNRQLADCHLPVLIDRAGDRRKRLCPDGELRLQGHRYRP